MNQVNVTPQVVGDVFVESALLPIAPVALDVRDLVFTYAGKDKPALHGLNFTIHRGEVFGFLGPSGAGKTTTQKILMGLLRGYQGTISVFDRPLRQWGASYYERIGVSFELPNHYQKLTASENLNFFRSLYQGNTEEPLKLLKMVGLGDDANRPVSQFSKGMQSRLTFIRALINRPDLIFLDEPTSGLDPSNARVVKDIVRALQSEGKTIFLTTHDMHVADELCDRIAFITQGRIGLIDTPRQMKLAYGRRLVRVEYRAENRLCQAQFPLDGLGANTDFLRLLTSNNIETLHTEEATLEDIFIQVTGETLQ
jgi:fluoroquinolone transport system ATP-binding protein